VGRDDKLDIPQGTLDLMILTILTHEPMHGYGISQRLAALRVSLWDG
jgi:DNA-binding PadR family transcriptional regulator